MAADTASLPVNGNFVPAQSQGYAMGDHSTSSHAPTNSMSAAPDYTGTSAMANSVGGNSNADIPKDEVGWYFVEQYYTTLSKSPEKLFLFYNKRSQFVSGSETEKVNVCVGQKAINDRIKELDIQDCKVRVTNVDSQGSGQNIVIQVIGEMSNRSAPQRKFTQTFILAEQTNGYFVLNDIFRYIVDEDDELEGESGYRAPEEPASSAAAESNTHTLTNSADPAKREQDASIVDAALEQQDSAAAEPAATVNGVGADASKDVVEAEEAPVAAADTEPIAPTDAAAVEEEIEAERPEAPEATPAASPPKKSATPAVAAAAAPKPAVPKTWANLVAAGQTKPGAQAATQAQTAAAAAQTPAAQSKPVPAAVQTQVPASTPSAAQDAEQPSTPQSSGSEWQTARHDHGKKQTKPQQAAPQPVENARAYIKNIGENIDVNMLRTELSKYGELQYIDIHRGKNCAFADFTTPAGYQAAVAANPHEVNGERIFVEERRVRPASMSGYPQRGGSSGRGRGSVDGRPGAQGRGGFQKEGGRGGFANRGRGNVNGRGRGVQQTA